MSCMGTAPAPAPPNPKVLVLLGRARDRPEARDECELVTGAPGIGTCPGARRAILGMSRAFT